MYQSQDHSLDWLALSCALLCMSLLRALAQQRGRSLSCGAQTRIEYTELESLWFLLLEQLFRPLRQLKSRTATPDEEFSGTKQLLTSLAQRVLLAMSAEVALPAVLDKISRDNPTDPFGDFRTVLLTMATTQQSEVRILTAANRILSRDAAHSLADLVRLRTAAAPVARTQRREGNDDSDIERKLLLERLQHYNSSASSKPVYSVFRRLGGDRDNAAKLSKLGRQQSFLHLAPPSS
jgi:hypothetical protein